MATSRMKSDTAALVYGQEVSAVFAELVQTFERERWTEMVETLERISDVGEKSGRREISIQAQSLRSAIETRARVSDSIPFREMSEQFDSLVTHLKSQLSHLAWTKDVSVEPPASRGSMIGT